MSSILNELYYGNLSPMDQIVHDAPEYLPLGRKIDDEVESLKKKLCEDDCARLEKIITDSLELSGMSEYAVFSHGMRIGIMLMSEVFSGGAK